MKLSITRIILAIIVGGALAGQAQALVLKSPVPENLGSRLCPSTQCVAFINPLKIKLAYYEQLKSKLFQKYSAVKADLLRRYPRPPSALNARREYNQILANLSRLESSIRSTQDNIDSLEKSLRNSVAEFKDVKAKTGDDLAPPSSGGGGGGSTVQQCDEVDELGIDFCEAQQKLFEI